MRIGVDLGGTKIELIALDAAGQRLHGERIATPAGQYDAILDAMAGLVARCEQATGRRGQVGVGTPGSLSPRDGLIRNANSTCLNGRALDRDLSERLQRPVRIANDANCFAISEAHDGAGAGADSVFGVILGTGVGGGLIIHGRLLEGANAIAGEWGHNPLPLPSAADRPLPPCYCGRQGCIETYLCGPALSADHLRRHGLQLEPAAIAAAAATGDPACEATLQRYEQRLARALASVINLLDPAVIVLGGGLSRLQRLYQNVPQLWTQHIFSDSVRTRLLPARHGDASGVRGAAWLWPADEIQD